MILRWIKKMQNFVGRWWYGPLASVLAGIDNLVLFIPVDGILASSTILKPSRWFYFACAITLGSTLGGLLLAALIAKFGMPFLDQYYPAVLGSYWWGLTVSFFDQYGLWVLLAVAAAPVPQQPAVVLSALAGTPLLKITLILAAGRFFKYLLIAYVASHFPAFINRLWGLQSELKDVGLK